MTYGELYALTNKIVHGLRAAGLQKGDQVTTVLPNSFEQVAVCMAAFQAGFYVTTVNWHLVGPEISYIVNDSETKALIVSDLFADEATRVLEDCVTPEANRFSVGDVKGFRPFADLVDGQSGERPDELALGSYMFLHIGHDRSTEGRSSGTVRRHRGRGGLDLGHVPHAVRHGRARRQRPDHPGADVPHSRQQLDHDESSHGPHGGADGSVDTRGPARAHRALQGDPLAHGSDDVQPASPAAGGRPREVRRVVAAPDGPCGRAVPGGDQEEDDRVVGRHGLGVLRGDRGRRHGRQPGGLDEEAGHGRRSVARGRSDRGRRGRQRPAHVRVPAPST